MPGVMYILYENGCFLMASDDREAVAYVVKLRRKHARAHGKKWKFRIGHYEARPRVCGRLAMTSSSRLH